MINNIAKFGGAMRKNEFMFESDKTFINHGSFGAAPRCVLERRFRLIEKQEQQPDVWFRELCDSMWSESKRVVADFLRARPENIVFVHNTTTGVNTILKSLEFQKGDGILIQTYTYFSVRNTCLHVAERHELEVVTVDLANLIKTGITAERLVDAYDQALSSHPNIRLVFLDYISSMPAMLMPIHELIRVCRRHGVMVFVDGAHTPGQLDLDLENLGTDFYGGNLHKWAFSPRGSAVLWVHPDYQRRVFPVVTSKGEDFDKKFSYQGTNDNSQYYTAQSALQFYSDIGGYDVIAKYNTELVAKAADMLVEKWGTEHYPIPDSMKAPFMRQVRIPQLKNFPFNDNEKLGDYDLTKLIRVMWHRFDVQSVFIQLDGQPWVRLSTMVYNTIEDYEKLADAILVLKAEEEAGKE